MRKSYGFRTFRILELAFYHSLGKLPDPQLTHDSSDELNKKCYGRFLTLALGVTHLGYRNAGSSDGKLYICEN
jgi:hypothetical protein